MNHEADPQARLRLGIYIKQLRTEQGLTLRGLAARAGVDDTWLARLERGIYARPGAPSIWRVARALDVEVADLYVTAGYTQSTKLPRLRPYLRAKYHLPEEAIQQLEDHFSALAAKYHLTEETDHE